MGKAPYKSAKGGGGGGGFFRVFSNLTTKERPCHVYSDTMLVKLIINNNV